MGHKAAEKPTDITIPSSSLWAKAPIIGGALAVLGLGATLAVGAGEHGGRAMFSYLWAFATVLCLTLGGICFVIIDHTVRANWSIVVRRIAEVMGVLAPLFALLLLPILTLGFHELYPWTHESDPILARKRWFLTPGFFMLRSAIYLAVFSFFGVMFYRLSVKQDGLGSDTTARDRITMQLRTIAGPGIPVMGLALSFAAIDWLMSLQPHWYSTIFGVYYFAASMLSFFAFMTLASMALQKAGVLKSAITTEHYHDMGKYVFGFTVFHAYIAVSQFLLIWYANIPEETEFYMVRTHGGWAPLSYALPIIHFFIPFLFLLSRHVKRHRVGLAVACVWTLVVHALDIYWLVLPNFGAHGEGSHFAPSWTDGAALLGMLGAFIAAFSFLMKKNAPVCLNDPRLPESLIHENY